MISEAIFAAVIAATPPTVVRSLRPECSEADRAIAARAIAAFEAKVSDSRSGANAEVERAFADLEVLPCLRFAAQEDHEAFAPGDALAIRDWWREGGSAWLKQELAGGDEAVVFPPGRRIVLRGVPNEGAAQGSPLTPILCRDGAAGCGKEARSVLARSAVELSHVTEGEEPDQGLSDECLAETKGHGEARYIDWRDCVEARRQRRAVLPLGEFKVPARGWLVFSDIVAPCGASTQAACSEIDAFNLSTGDVYATRSCEGKKKELAIGVIRTDVVRELALITLMSSQIRFVRPGATLPGGDDLKREIAYGTPRRWQSEGMTWVRGEEAKHCPACWFELRDGDAVADGMLTAFDLSYLKGSPDEAGSAYALVVRDAAMASLVPKCPSSQPPRWAWRSSADAAALTSSRNELCHQATP
jgi:hypothetical protein